MNAAVDMDAVYALKGMVVGIVIDTICNAEEKFPIHVPQLLIASLRQRYLNTHHYVPRPAVAKSFFYILLLSVFQQVSVSIDDFLSCLSD